MEKKGILVYLECSNGHILKVSLEALNAGKKLASDKGLKLAGVLVNAGGAADEAAAYGAGTVLTAEMDNLCAESCAELLKKLAADYEPAYILAGSTKDGKDAMARAAAACSAALVTDAIDLVSEGWVRSIYGGSLFETVETTGLTFVSVRAGSFGKPEYKEETAVIETVQAPCIDLKTIIKESVKEIGESVNLEDAEVIVAGGRGMGSPENFKLVEELAAAFGGVVGASRPAIEAGWISRDHQVGQSGKIVAPKLYIACGISGSVQHVSGMTGSGYILAINKDEDAPIFEVADCGIVGNCMEVLPLLIEEVKKCRA